MYTYLCVCMYVIVVTRLHSIFWHYEAPSSILYIPYQIVFTNNFDTMSRRLKYKSMKCIISIYTDERSPPQTTKFGKKKNCIKIKMSYCTDSIF